MNKQEIIDKLFDKLNKKGCRYPKWELYSIIDPFLEVIKESMEESEDVKLTNFGKSTVKTQKGRRHYNVNTQRNEYSSDKKMVVFIRSRNFTLDSGANNNINNNHS